MDARSSDGSPTGILEERRETGEERFRATANRGSRPCISIHKGGPRLAQHGILTQRGCRRVVSGDVRAEPVRLELVIAGDGGRDGKVRATEPPDDPADDRLLTNPVGGPSDDLAATVEDPGERERPPTSTGLKGNHRTKLALGHSGQERQTQMQPTDSWAQAQPGPALGDRHLRVGEQHQLIGRVNLQALSDAVDLHPEPGLLLCGDAHARTLTPLPAAAPPEQRHPESRDKSRDGDAREN